VSDIEVFVIIVIVVALVLRAAIGKARGADTGVCAGCGASHPRMARFCRRCGRKL
jgi:ribosomal protein L40E